MPETLPRYQCHKIVEAAKIRAIHQIHPDEGNGLLLLFEDHVPEQLVTYEWRVKHVPDVGGYFIRYADGYESYSPAAVFEAGYSRLPDERQA